MTGIAIASSGILAQLLLLFGKPIFLFFQNKEKGSRRFLSALISLRAVWAIFAYWSIWYEFSHPDEWDLNTPGSALITYAAIFPILILVLDWLVLGFIGVALSAFSLKRKSNSVELSPTKNSQSRGHKNVPSLLDLQGALHCDRYHCP